MSNKRCCVPGCLNNKAAGVTDTLHKFPNPFKDKELFNSWVYAIGGDILQLENMYIFKCRRVCHIHFEEKYWCRNNRLSNIALPKKHLPGLRVSKFIISEERVLRGIQTSEPSTSRVQTKMDYQKWKRFKRSGGYRRKINKVNSELLQRPENVQVGEVGAVHSDNYGSVQYISQELDCSNYNMEEEDSEDDSNETDLDKDLMFQKNIKMWAIRNNISHLACNELFDVINKRYENVLPKDARSLLKTNT